MKIKNFELEGYDFPLTTGQMRSGALLHIETEDGHRGCGDVAPLPKWSRETLSEATNQLESLRHNILNIEWTPANCFEQLKQLKLVPSALFGIESALLSILLPVDIKQIKASALLQGTPLEILEQASLRAGEGFTSAKLKVGHLHFQKAAELIHQLKERFRLRIDVNRAWNRHDALQFFAQFPLDTFDYVEEPFQNPHELAYFTHPLAVDESFPSSLALSDLERLPTLKALVYKPTMQGGMLNCLPLKRWAQQHGVDIVISSSYESEIGLGHLLAIVQRMQLQAPVGIGTYHFLKGKPVTRMAQLAGFLESAHCNEFIQIARGSGS